MAEQRILKGFLGLNRYIRFFTVSTVLFIVLFDFSSSHAKSTASQLKLIKLKAINVLAGDTTEPDTSKIILPYNFPDEGNYADENDDNKSTGLIFRLPSNINSEVEYDARTGQYIFSQRIGDLNYRHPGSMSMEEYKEYDFQKSINDYWYQKFRGESFANQSSLIPKLHVGGEIFDKIFGSNTINIQPTGSAELIFGINISNNGNPTLPEKLRRTTTFDFQEKIQMNVTGQIGDKMRIQTNYNTESTFDFENKMNLRYEGKEDEIIQIIEAGDVTLPLSGTLITGSQSLFGLKTELKFGKLRVTSVFSQQKGESSSIEVEGGAQLNDFEVQADDYEANKHFFLSQFFKDHYDQSLRTMPIISSGITISKIEVWVTNKSGNYQNARNIVGFLDLGESAYPPGSAYGMYPGNSNIFNEIIAANVVDTVFPSNGSNSLYQSMRTTYAGIRDISQISAVLSAGELISAHFLSGQDYEKIEKARKLNSSEYTLNDKLGFISVNGALNADEVLAVAYEYTYQGQIFRVGEFTSDGPADPSTLILKLLKGTYLSPNIRIDGEKKRSPSWELMMKNIYAIGAYQVNPEDFLLNVLYRNDLSGTSLNYLSEGPSQEEGGINGMPLITVFNLDNLNSNLDPSPDGIFDFVEGVTVYAQNGRIIFPVREPFGSHLRTKITGGDPNLDIIADKYVYEELYDSTKTFASQQTEKNKFFMKGTYMSASSSEIRLNALNIPQGSVKVTAGGMQLVENQDYQVDYTMGTVKITNQGLLESGTPIKISLESNSMFNIQSKTLFGTHFDYRINDDFNIGATILNLTERPLTSKVNIGDEPISNTIWGIDGNYRSDLPFLTKMVDWIPFLETKEMSSIQMYGEFAHLIPGHSKAIDKSGTAYIDDFEGSKTSIDIRNYGAWVLASTPQHQPELFPEANITNDLAYGYNRAKLAWYTIDPLFLRNNSATPTHIENNADLQSSHFVREVFEKEIFPNKETPNGIPTNISVLNLAFYPSEKGPYNFDLESSSYSQGLLPDGSGLLSEPRTRWGGIMRKIETNDFEAANIEFIEFWMMDPFAEDADSSHAGGNLYFNLGNISEDILKDSRKSFENGMPGPNDSAYVDTTIWGKIPLIQSLVNGFDNDNNKRPYQDIGFDGLSSNPDLGDEQDFHKDYLAQIEAVYGAASAAYQDASKDPSSDDFHYFRGTDYDNAQLGILERYKNFNGTEGNSPASEQFVEDYPTSSTTIPDVEDINNDNTLSEGESYYQYILPITYQNLRVDKNYINDEIKANVTFKNGDAGQVTWYQFKIPIYEPDQVIGSISDFKSIRFIRMFLKDFDEQVVLRFAKMDLVRGEWRKYNQSLRGPGEYEPTPQPVNATFDVSAVNIEENGNKSPVNYVLPPGIDRVIDPTNPQLRQLNEQSIVLQAFDLEDGDAKAAYRNVTMDIRQYKRLKMEVHAEQIDPFLLNDKDLRVFIRVGSDYKQNYYEYEVPLTVTPAGRYNNDSNADRLIVWPDQNRIDVELAVFQTVKQLRNDANRENPENVNITAPYSRLEGELVDDGSNFNRVTVTGNPNLSNVRTIMIGIRNPKANSVYAEESDDALPKTGEIWLNELRLTDFDEEGGWAANARVMTRLADFGTVTIAGSTSKPGFGSIEQKVNERSKEETYQYDISSNFELGKFFSEESGVRIPLYMGISENVRNPEYNPLDPDIPFKIALDNAANKQVRDSIKTMAQDYTRRKSLNFTNVQINKRSVEQPKIWDIANWSASYAYNELFSRNVNTEYNVQKDYRGGLSYNFNNRPKNISPFKKSKNKLLKSKYLRLIKDFNFYYLPQQISFRTDLTRNYKEAKMRNITTDHLSNAGIEIPATYQKNFTWNRQYDLKYDLSKSLKLDFSATNQARIDEPDGMVDRKGDPALYQAWKDSVWQNLRSFGRTTNYHQMMNLNWNIPINRFPFLDWTSLTARYNSTYDWIASPLLVDTINLGNTIKNSGSAQLNGQVNLLTLYNKVPYLKTINQKYGRSRGRGAGRGGARGGSRGGRQGKDGGKEEEKDGTELVEFTKTGLKFKANVPKSIVHNLGTEDVEVTAFDGKGERIFGEQKIVNEERVTYKMDKDFDNVKIVVKGRKKSDVNYLKIILERSLSVMMGVKNFSVSVQQSHGSTLPGYLPDSRFFGSKGMNGAIAPGIPFILGWQDRNFASNAANRGWITNDPTLNTPYAMNSTQTINFRSSIEPISGMRVDITAQRTMSENISEFYLADTLGTFHANSLRISGNFTITVLTLGTSFEKSADDHSSLAFEAFRNNRITIAKRLRDDRLALGSDPDYNGGENPENGFPEGYGPTSQEVLIPAFIAAYSNIDPSKVSLATFPGFFSMKPNWRVNWDGLSKIEWVKKYVKTVAINHTYRSTFNVGGYNTNLQYDENEDGLSMTRDLLDNFLPKNEISSVSINEQYSPLLNFDITWNNSLTSKIEMKKTRNLTLSFSNQQITEVKNQEFIVGVGYRFDDVEILVFNKEFKSDLTLRFDFSLRENKTVLRPLDGVPQATTGQQMLSIKSNADYILSDRFNLRMFLDYTRTSPFVSTTYPTSNWNFGFSVRFTLAG